MNVAARVRAEIEAGARTAVKDLAGGDLARVTASLVDDAHRAGDAYARALWDEVGELLGTAIANLVTILNPARVILGGACSSAARALGRGPRLLRRGGLALGDARALRRARVARRRRRRRRRRRARVTAARLGESRRVKMGCGERPRRERPMRIVRAEGRKISARFLDV